MKNIFRKRWSKWTDISVGAALDYRYLLQARRYEDGMVEFRVAQIANAYGCNMPTMEQLKEIQG